MREDKTSLPIRIRTKRADIYVSRLRSVACLWVSNEERYREQVGAFERVIEARRGRENGEPCSREREREREREEGETDPGIKSRVTASMYTLLRSLMIVKQFCYTCPRFFAIVISDAHQLPLKRDSDEPDRSFDNILILSYNRSD